MISDTRSIINMQKEYLDKSLKFKVRYFGFRRNFKTYSTDSSSKDSTHHHRLMTSRKSHQYKSRHSSLIMTSDTSLYVKRSLKNLFQHWSIQFTRRMDITRRKRQRLNGIRKKWHTHVVTNKNIYIETHVNNSYISSSKHIQINYVHKEKSFTHWQWRNIFHFSHKYKSPPNG